MAVQPNSSTSSLFNSNGGLGFLKAVIWLTAFCLVAYILGPPLYWHFTEALAAAIHSFSSSSCPPCTCDCSSSQKSLFSMPQGITNFSFVDCGQRDPEVSEEMDKNFMDLLSEELKLRQAEATENQRHADVALLEAKKLASQYQKEADKCNSGMETCEEAREKAEAALLAQKRVSAAWEMRARQRGWKEGTFKSFSQS